MSLADIICLVSDDNGYVYGINVKRQLLIFEVTTTGNHTCVEEIEITPQLQFHPTQIAVSRTGKSAVVVGHAADSDSSSATLLDLHGGRPILTGGGPKKKQCQAHEVDSQFFATRGGLNVWQLKWHPYSDLHFAMLTSDNRFRIYCVMDVSLPEQTFHLQINTTARLGVWCPPPSHRVQGFAFCQPHAWGTFTVLFMCSDGAVYSVCPVAPFGMRCHWPLVNSLTVNSLSAAAKQWLQAAFPNLPASANLGRPQTLEVLPHALPALSPMLQGPLQAAAGLDLQANTTPAVSIAVSSHTVIPRSGGLHTPPQDGSISSSQPIIATAVLTAQADGTVQAHALQGDWQPAWADVPPEYLEDEAGIISSVQCACCVAPTHTQRSAGLLLLDVIELPHPQAPPHPDDLDEVDSADGQAFTALHQWLSARPQLLSIPSLPGSFWMTCPDSIWAISVPWLHVLPRMLLQLASSDADAGEATPPLPRPVVRRALADTVSGQRTAVLPCGRAVAIGTGGTLHCCRALGAAQHAAEGASGRTNDLNSAGPAIPELDELYGLLLAGPTTVVMPKPRGPAGSQDSEGIRYLADSIAQLNTSSVTFVHSAHGDLTKRAQQVANEVQLVAQLCKEQRELARNVQGQYNDELRQRILSRLLVQQELTKRVEAARQRVRQAPRPLSRDEVALQQQLPSWKQQLEDLQETWEQLASNVKALQVPPSPAAPSPRTPYRMGAMPASSPTPAKPSTPHLPQPSLANMFAVLKQQQDVALPDLHQTLARLESVVQTHKQEEQLKDRLGSMDLSRQSSGNGRISVTGYSSSGM